MKTITRTLLFISLFSFNLAMAGQLYESGSPGHIVRAKGVAGIMAPVLQRGRVIAPAAVVESGYAVVDVVGADDVIEVILRGNQVTFKTVSGQKPQRVTANFSSPIPNVPDLILSVTKLDGRGNVGLTGRPARANNYSITLRVMDSARGKDNCKFRLDWRLPGTTPAAAVPPPATRAPVARSTRTPQVITRDVPSRITNSKMADAGYVELKIDGVDDIVEVEISGNRTQYRTVRGINPQQASAEFSSPVPQDASLSLSVSKSYGRGNISLTEKPSASNNYTTTVRLVDPRGGKDNYKFRINWEKGRSVRAPLTSKREISRRIASSRLVDEGYVELKLDGVDDIVEVEISGNNAQYLTVRGVSPQKAEAAFSSPVPRDATISLDIVKSYGRGEISLAERPTAANNYTTTVRLNDTRGGRDNYKFRVNWEKNGSARTRASSATSIPASSIPARSGHVEVFVDGADDIVDIRIRGEQVENKAVKGGTPRQVRAEFSTPLPLVPISGLVLNKISGRGNVVLMEGPDQANDFTATVRIVDSERAQDNYSFRLTWEVSNAVPSGSSNYTGSYENVYDNNLGQGGYQRISAYAGSSFKYTKEGSFTFRAIVDDTALIKIENGELWGMTLKGHPVRVLDARFSQGYPQGDMERLDIAILQGRGDVEILEKPWSGNNYAIVVRIHDSRGGDDEYGFELRWKQR